MEIENDVLVNVWSREKSLSYLNSQLHSGNRVSIVLVDVDFFVNIDSKVGKSEGDNILIGIGEFFKKIDGCEAGRYGGDEFILIFHDIDNNYLCCKVESMRKSFRKERFISSSSIYAKVPMTISMGISYSSESGKDLTDLLKKAEIALSMAKKRGRNQYAVAPEGNVNALYDENVDVCTVIGGGLRGYYGDGGYACKAGIVEPYGIDISLDGSLILADRGNHVIRKIDKDGIISTIAGTGDYGYDGDGKDAVYARLNKPSGVAVDKNNNIYIADTGNHCIRKVDSNGWISTIAGCGKEGYCGDGGKGIDAKLSRPGGVVVDIHGNVYTNDYGNNVIRKISKDGIISTVVGCGKYGYDGDGAAPIDASINKPYGLAVTKEGDKIFVADYGNNCIRQADMVNNLMSTVCGTGEAGYSDENNDAGKSKINGPFWMVVYGNNLLFIADSINNCIRVCNLEKKKINTFIGKLNPGYNDGMISNGDIQMNIPAGMAVNPKKNIMYIADYGNNAIRKVNFDSRLLI